MRFQILSHAGLLVEHAGKTLITDPWLVGSCYWRSWWNYPPVSEELIAGLKPDVIYLTHVHWDHFHGPSLKRFDPNTLIVVPHDHQPRLTDDLADMGYPNVRELKHGETMEIGPDFTLTSYHIMPYLDSAAVISAGGTVILNANDAKFVGLPLQQIINEHPKIDFVLRSHSSANDRVCYDFIDGSNVLVDDKERYIKAFAYFAAAARAKYAIPFASNHCHMQDDVYALNSYIQTPRSVAEYCNGLFEKAGVETRAVVMLSGDSWSPDTGFDIKENDWFESRDQHLAEYKQRVQPSLDKTAAKEAATKVTEKQISKFFLPFLDKLAFFQRKKLEKHPLDLRVTSGDQATLFRIDAKARTITELPADTETDMAIIIPAAILRMSMMQEMFAHAAISKRLRYRVTKETFPVMEAWLGALYLSEQRLIPLTRLARPEFIKTYLRRWREIPMIGQFLFAMARGERPENVELRMLADASGIKLDAAGNPVAPSGPAAHAAA